MIPLIPTIALAFFSFICSAFVILRIVIPILPPGPLSRRVSPSEFGLPNFRSLSPADKSNIWLTSLNLIAVAVFTWEAVSEATGGPSGFAIADSPLASVRLWFSLTFHQTCLLVILGLTLLHVRLARSVSFGSKHWMMWGPTMVLVVTSTAIAGVLAASGMQTLFVGLAAYSAVIAALSSVALLCLIGTLLNIKRNLAVLNEDDDSWPPATAMEEKPRPSFTTDEVDALRDGASWITSNASSRSRCDSVSAWSFSTHRTHATSHHGRPQNSHPSVPAKSSFWFGSTPAVNNVPPVPPLPSPYGPLSPTAETLAEPDPFRREPTPVPEVPRPRLGSQTSWLTSSNGSHATMSAWSYPTTHHDGNSSANLHVGLLPNSVSRPSTPALASAQVLGGYGYTPKDSEKGLSTLAAPAGTSLDISAYRAIGWLALNWLPLGLSLPYLIAFSQDTPASPLSSVLLTISVMSYSPILALNMMFSPLPIPTGLFDVHGDIPSNFARGSTTTTARTPTLKLSHEYKTSASASVTVVEGRRSGDVWLSNGDAIDGKNKFTRALGMISPMPKLSVLPFEEEGEITPPLPIQDGDSSLPVSIHNRSHSESSAQFGRIRKDSKASSSFSVADESVAFASRIMVAQRHYSALAQTVHVSASPEKRQSTGGHLMTSEVVAATGATVSRAPSGRSQHLRSRSVTSVSGPQTPTGYTFGASPSPPPAFPLPPTPPNVRAARLAKHKRSYSSTSAEQFSFGAVDDMNEIDALTAGVLPILVPGLTVGGGMKIRDSPPATWRRRKAEGHSRSRSRSGVRGEGKTAKLLQTLNDFGEEWSSPEFHSTPARTKAGASKAREARTRKTSAHKRNHMSLPSLGLGKDGVHSLAVWSNEVGRAFENIGQYTSLPKNVDVDRRKTVFGGESATGLSNLRGAPEPTTSTLKASNLGRAMSTRTLGLKAEVPHGVDTARSSMISVARLPPSAASTVTLFEDFLADGPQAESTPYNSVAYKRISENVPPLPSANPLRDSINNPRSSRRSSIVYIRSDDNATTVTPPNQVTSAAPNSSSSLSSFAQWSSRAVRPLIPKTSKLQRKASKVDPAVQAANKADSPRSGLRPLSLLQDRDTNTYDPSASSTVSVKETRPLFLGKKQTSRKAMAPGTTSSRTRDENSPEQPRLKKQHNLKPLKLARNDTNKMRAILREEEELPDVVVRPPSNTEHQVYAYTFRG